MIGKAGVLIVALLFALTVPSVMAQEKPPGTEPPAPPEPPGKVAYCFAPNDNVSKAAARASCDGIAETAGYAHGVVIPCEAAVTDGEDALVVCKCGKKAEDGTFIVTPKVRPYSCVGVPHQQD